MQQGLFRSYLDQSKNGVNSLVFVAPLFVLYQVGILFTHGWVNGADFVTCRLLALFEGNRIYYSIFNVAVLAVIGCVFFFLRKRRVLHPRTYGMMLVESCLYAFVMGGVAARILFAVGISPPMRILHGVSSPQLPEGVLDSIVLSIGAGTYEELFFRLILLGGLFFILGRTKLKKWQSALIAIGVSSLLFSVFHYVPIGIEPWQLWSFTFRFLLGIILAVIYITRGFAIAVYTHAIYDIFILVPRALGL